VLAGLISGTSFWVAPIFRPDLLPILCWASLFSISTIPYTLVVCESQIPLQRTTLDPLTTQKCCPLAKRSSKLPMMLPSPTKRLPVRSWSARSSVNGKYTISSGYLLPPSPGAWALPLSCLPSSALQIARTLNLPGESPHRSVFVTLYDSPLELLMLLPLLLDI
jgi:hypothetical protein